MPRRLSPRATVVVVSLLFSACFGLQTLGRSSAPEAAVRATPPLVERPGPAPTVSLGAAQRVPALRDPLKPKPKPKRKRKPRHRKVVVAPKPAPVRIVPRPAATAAPRRVVVPAPRPAPVTRAPAPTPKAKPAPSGSFDTSGTG